MNQPPLVSVIIPFYNLESCVTYCLDSVLCQTYHRIEVICIDDGSTDGTLELLRAYAAHDFRVICFAQDNSGQAVARNKGVELAKGDYVAFIDGDDYVAPNYIEALVEGLDSGEYSLAIAGYGDVDYGELPAVADREMNRFSFEWREVSVSDLLYRDLVSCCWGRIAKKKLFADNPLKQRYYEDVEVGARYIRASTRIVFLDCPLYFHVRRPGSTVNVGVPSGEQVREYASALEAQRIELESMDVDSSAISYNQALHWSRVYRLASRSADCAETRLMKKRAASEIRSRIWNIVSDRRAPVVNKLRLIMVALLPSLYCCAFDAFMFLKGSRRLAKGRFV